MSKAFNEMSVQELREEQQYWQEKIDESPNWGAGVAAAIEFRDECARHIRFKNA